MGTTFDGWTLEGIKNPNLLQSLILDKFKDSTDGKFEIVDGNNVTSFLIEGFSSIASQAIRKIDDTALPAIYPSRATTVGDLYKHLSDYDYLGLFASPAACSILLVVSKDYLMNNAVDVIDENGLATYRKVTIPKTTRFTIGQYVFGLYYPIDIRVSEQTGMFTVMYNTTENNPLHVLSDNVLEYSFRKHNGMNLAYIKIPVYQFNTSAIEEPLISGSGYRRVVNYTDKFYALRCFAEVRDPETDQWTRQELALALSGRTYNPEKPTVVFKIDPLNKQCILDIPYIYFTSDLVRGNLYVEIYTTAGYLNYQIPLDTEELVGIDMFGIPLSSENQRFAEPFRKMPALAALPITSKILGGTDGMSYNDLRRKVVNDAFGDKTLQTPADVDAYFANIGYVTSLFKDGITDRIFNAHIVLRANDDSVIASASIDTKITTDTLENSNTRSIINCGDGTYTILPSMRYRLDEDKGICIPLTDDELDDLNNKSAADRVAAFNKNTYTLSPFHLQISIKDRYPTTVTYDLTDAALESREFLTARDVSKQLTLNSVSMSVIKVDSMETSDRVTDKYKLRFKVIKSGLDDVEAVVSESAGATVGLENIRVVVGLKKLDGSYAFALAKYIEHTADVDVFDIDIEAVAVFTTTDIGHAVRIKSPFSSTGVDVYLNTEMRVILCLAGRIGDLANFYMTDTHKDKFLETDYTDMTDELIDSFIALSEHRINLRFGKLVNEVDQRISLTYKGLDYETYGTTEFATTEVPIFDLDENGIPTYTTVNGNVVLNTKYATGTLKCFTQQQEEAVVLSRFLAANYAGCAWRVDDSEDAIWKTGSEALPQPTPGSNYWDLSSSGEGIDTIKQYEGVTLTIMSPITPRFAISATKTLADGTMPLVGMYELNNAGDPTRGGYSTVNDEWFRTVTKENETTSSRVVTTYKVSVVNALKFILDDILDNSASLILPGKSDDNTWYAEPLKQITSPVDGMFVFVEDDHSEVESPAFATFLDVPTSDDAEVDEELTSEIISHLYYRKDGKWQCIVECRTYDQLKRYVNLYSDGYKNRPEEDKYIAGKKYYELVERGGVSTYVEKTGINPGDDILEKDNVYTCNPAYFGFAYVVEVIERVSISSGERRKISLYDEDNPEVKYVSFMTHREDGTIDLSQLKVLRDDGINPTDIWKSRVNRWPWEVEEWYGLDKSIFNGARVYVSDDAFETTFDRARLAKYCLHTADQVRLSEFGKPIVKKSTNEVQYLVNMIQVDAKLAETTAAKASHSYPADIVETMRTHFNNLGSVKNRLYTSTKLYFEPMKSLGYASFYTDGATTRDYQLDIRMGFRLHVSSDIAEDDSMMEAMRESIVKLIDDHIAEGSTNLAAIAKLIKEKNSDSVRYVDVLGIGDGSDPNDKNALNPDLQTMRCVDSFVRPHLKHELKLLDDGVTIDLTRGLDLEFVTADV